MRKFKFMICLTVAVLGLSTATAMATTMSALTSMETQTAKEANTPYPIKVAGEDSGSFKIEGSKVTILHAGDFYLSAAAQVGGSKPGEIYLWMRVNGKDVDDSNSIQTIPAAGFTTVLVSQTGFTFKKGDVVEFVYAASVPGLGVIASHPKNMPGVPSIIFSIFEL